MPLVSADLDLPWPPRHGYLERAACELEQLQAIVEGDMLTSHPPAQHRPSHPTCSHKTRPAARSAVAHRTDTARRVKSPEVVRTRRRGKARRTCRGIEMEGAPLHGKSDGLTRKAQATTRPQNEANRRGSIAQPLLHTPCSWHNLRRCRHRTSERRRYRRRRRASRHPRAQHPARPPKAPW